MLNIVLILGACILGVIDMGQLMHFVYRRLPHVSLEESPKAAKPSHSLDLSDTDTECDVAASVSLAVNFHFADAVVISHL